MTTAVYPSPREGALPFTAAILGTVVGLIALPIVLLAGGPASGWMLGFGLWVANWLAQLATTKMAAQSAPTTAVGLTGISLMARAWGVAIVLFLVAIRGDKQMALTAAFVFLAAFTFDLAGRALLFSMQHDRTHSTAGNRTDR